MSKLRLVLFFITLISFSGFANAMTETKSPINETSQIQKYLMKSDFSTLVDNETKVNVTFLINAKGELVITSTSNNNLDSAIKAVLNYKNIEVSTLKYNVLYTIPLIIKK